MVGEGEMDYCEVWYHCYEDPDPLNGDYCLVLLTIWCKRGSWNVEDQKTGVYLVGRDGTEELIIEGDQCLFDPQPAGPRYKPHVIPAMLNRESTTGHFYVQNVYEGTHILGAEKGTVKSLRVVESTEKRSWTSRGWVGQGEQAPGVNGPSLEPTQSRGD